MKFKELAAQQWARYERLSDREQLFAICAAFVIFLALFVLIVWNPIHTAKNDAKQRYEAEMTLQAEIKRIKAQKRSKKPVNASSQNQSLLAIVNETTANQGLSLKRVEPKNNASLRVWLDNVPFNRLVAWLELLQVNHNVVVDTLSVDQAQTPGMVNTALVLAR